MTRSASRQRGVILVITLWVMVILLVLAVGFLAGVSTQTRLTGAYGQEAQAEYWARAGLVRVLQAMMLDETPSTPPGEPWFELDSDLEGWEQEGWRFLVFVEDLCGRLNVNTASEEMLLNLLGDPLLADPLLDWRDADESPRAYGVESEYYVQLETPYQARNGPLESVEELLLIARFSPEIVYGSEALQVSPLAAREATGQALTSESQGMIPLIRLLTTYSGDVNVAMDGLARVNLRTASQEELQQRLGEILSEQEIQRLISYREGEQSDQQEGQPQGTQGAAQTPGSPTSTGLPAGSLPAGSQMPGSSRPPASRQTSGGLPTSGLPGQTLGGLPTSGLPGISGAQPPPGQTMGAPQQQLGGQQPSQQERFQSLAELLQLLGREKVSQILDLVTVRQEHFLPGQINLNTARREVLMSLPGMTEEGVEAILAYREAQGGFSTVGDLLSLSEISDDVLGRVIDQVTVRSSAFRVVVRAVSPDESFYRDLEVVVWVDLQPASPASQQVGAQGEAASEEPQRTIQVVEWRW